MEFLIAAATTLAGLFVLAYSGDKLVEGASALAQRLKVSDVFIGIVIIGFGTSLPEVMATVSAAWMGKNEMALGNVIGSNIANVGLILAAALLLAKSRENLKGNKRDYFTMLAAMALFTILLLIFEKLSLFSGILLLVFLAFYLFLSLKSSKKGFEDEGDISLSMGVTLLLVLGGLIGLALGANFLINGATSIARMFGVSERVIGITLVALGTSLPELAAAVAAARKGNLGLTVGNILGSNVFNVLAAASASAVFMPLHLDGFHLDLTVMMLFALVTSLLFTGRIKISYSILGLTLLGGYAVYTLYLIMMTQGQ
ncbi:MAG: calcium/sodium antiporter [Alphaproteobacteria bacterium]|nr:calcium/sodium antiporter [Alphaproteobacteria bacterium]MDD9919281.1 calcium/sodium antiporter [Alphaproteobacteria bacterium]